MDALEANQHYRVLSHFIIDYWDEEISDQSPREAKQHAVETIRDLYSFLAAQGHVPAEAASRVTQAAKTLFSHPKKLTPIPK